MNKSWSEDRRKYWREVSFLRHKITVLSTAMKHAQPRGSQKSDDGDNVTFFPNVHEQRGSIEHLVHRLRSSILQAHALWAMLWRESCR